MERECVACFVIYRLTHFLANLRGTCQTIQLFIDKLLCCFMKQFFNAGSDQYIKNSPPTPYKINISVWQIPSNCYKSDYIIWSICISVASSCYHEENKNNLLWDFVLCVETRR